MPTVLHVVGSDLDAASRFALRCLLERLTPAGFVQRVALLSGVARADLERELGVPVAPIGAAARLARLTGLDWLAGAGLRTTGDAPVPSILHAWGAAALHACRLSANSATIADFSNAVYDDQARGLRAALDARTVLVVGAQSTRRRLAQRGVNPAQVVVIRRPVDFRAIQEARQRDLRRQLLGDAEGPLIVTSGPASPTGGHYNAAWAALLVQQVRAGLRLVVPFDSPRREMIRRFAASIDMRYVLVDAPEDWGWPELASAADVLIDAPDEDAPTEPIAWAMAAGAAVVGSAVRSVTELIADRHNGLLCRGNDPHPLARVLLRMLEDQDLRRKLVETARGQAYEVFSLREYADNVRRTYENALTSAAPGAGVRDTAMA